MSVFYIDGYQLIEPNKGLAVVTEGLVFSIAALNEGIQVFVFVPAAIQGDLARLNAPNIKIIPLFYKSFKTNYLDRISWTRAISRYQRKFNIVSIFFPYQQNAGALSRNYVYFPDLIGIERRNLTFSIKKIIRRYCEENERRRVAHARKILTYSHFVKEEFLERYPAASQNIRVVPLAPQRGLMQYDRETALKAIGEVSYRRFILYVGGYAERKNTTMLLDACLLAGIKCPDLHCVFVGGSTSPRIVEAAGKYPDTITILPFLDAKTVSGYYSLCDFTVYPSHSEGFGLPIIEASLFGKPCLCGNNTSQVELQPESDLLIDSGDMGAWVEKICDYWTDAEKLQSASVSALQNGQKYSWPRTAKMIAELTGVIPHS